MKNKTRDLIAIIVSLIVFLGALIFIIDNMGEDKKSSDPSLSFDRIEEPIFEYEYDKELIEEIDEFIDYGSPDPNNLGKQNIFIFEEGSNPNAQQEEEESEEQEEEEEESDSDNNEIPPLLPTSQN